MGDFFHKKVRVTAAADPVLGFSNERALKLIAEHGDKFWVLNDTNNVFLLAPENPDDLYRGVYNLREVCLAETE